MVTLQEIMKSMPGVALHFTLLKDPTSQESEQRLLGKKKLKKQPLIVLLNGSSCGQQTCAGEGAYLEEKIILQWIAKLDQFS